MRVAEKDKLWTYYENCDGEPLDKVEKRQLADLMRSTIIRRAFGLVYLEIRAAAEGLANIDLGKQESILLAVKTQGKVQGMKRFIDALFDLTETEEEEGGGPEN